MYFSLFFIVSFTLSSSEIVSVVRQLKKQGGVNNHEGENPDRYPPDIPGFLLSYPINILSFDLAVFIVISNVPW